jgi:hypothetical protein
MGFYIETPMDKGKADFLIQNHRAQEIHPPIVANGEMIPVCVVDNGPFEAAGIAFDRGEVDVFLGGSPRPKRWLLMPLEEILKLCPKVGEYLNW